MVRSSQAGRSPPPPSSPPPPLQYLLQLKLLNLRYVLVVIFIRLYLPVFCFRSSTCVCLGEFTLAVHGCDCCTKLAHWMQSLRKVVQHLHNMWRQVSIGSPFFGQVVNLFWLQMNEKNLKTISLTL